jgi:hypothetical protein
MNNKYLLPTRLTYLLNIPKANFAELNKDVAALRQGLKGIADEIASQKRIDTLLDGDSFLVRLLGYMKVNLSFING